MKNYFSFGILVPVLFLIFSGAHSGYHIGDTVSDFSLKSTSGNFVSLEDYQDAKGYIVVFTCNHCPYAVLYEDRLVDLHNKYAPMGYPVIAINPNDPEAKPDDSFENMGKRAAEKSFPFVYLFDDGQKVYPEWGATKTPHVYLLDGDKKVRYIGALDDSAKDPESVEVKYVENAIAALEAGTKIDPETTKAIGCSIKTVK